jgi:hypothetical protein
MYTQEQIEQWEKKAEKWDALETEIGKYYPDLDENDNEIDPIKEGDLTDIGEVAAIAFGFM